MSMLQKLRKNKMKTLQEKLDLAAKELEPILWDLLDEIEKEK
jgi:hypothetical protein